MLPGLGSLLPGPPACVLLLLLAAAPAAARCPMLCTCYPAPPTVSCQANNFSAVPRALPPGTQRLFLQNNLIGALRPGSFGPSLLTLWLFSNNLSAIYPGTFRHLQALEELDLGDNRHLRSLEPDTFQGLERLQSLHLYRCQLSSLPGTIFRGLVSLQYLYLQENSLVHLQEAIAGPANHPRRKASLSVSGLWISSCDPLPTPTWTALLLPHPGLGPDCPAPCASDADSDSNDSNSNPAFIEHQPCLGIVHTSLQIRQLRPRVPKTLSESLVNTVPVPGDLRDLSLTGLTASGEQGHRMTFLRLHHQEDPRSANPRDLMTFQAVLITQNSPRGSDQVWGGGTHKSSRVGLFLKAHALESARPEFKSWSTCDFGQITQPFSTCISSLAIMILLNHINTDLRSFVRIKM